LLSPEERTRIVFEHYKSAEPKEAFALPMEPEKKDSELQEFVHARQSACQPTPPEPEGLGPQPAPVAAAIRPDLPAAPAGRWEMVTVAGHFPAKRRRVWVPFSPGEEAP
jgi:hypothetical protein